MTQAVLKAPVSISITITLLVIVIACNLLLEIIQPIGITCAKTNSVTRSFSNLTKRLTTTTPSAPSVPPSNQYQLNEGDLSLWYCY